MLYGTIWEYVDEEDGSVDVWIMLEQEMVSREPRYGPA